MAILTLGIASTGGYFLWQKMLDRSDLAAWQQAQKLDQSSSYKKYLSEYPNGKHIFDVRQALKTLAKPWSLTFGGAQADSGHAIASLPGGDIVVAGRIVASDGGNIQAWITRLNERGEKVWEKKFGKNGIQSFQSVKPLPDGSIIAAGFSLTNPGGHFKRSGRPPE